MKYQTTTFRTDVPASCQTNHQTGSQTNSQTKYPPPPYDTPIRSYGKGELATMYNPHISSSAARKKLTQWMHHHPTLMPNLFNTGYNEMQRTFTPLQVKLIFDALGEP